MRELITTGTKRLTNSVDLCENSTLAATWEYENEHTSWNLIDFLNWHIQRRNGSNGNPTVTLSDSENHLLESLGILRVDDTAHLV